MDASAKFLGERSSMVQQVLQHAGRNKSREGEDGEKEDGGAQSFLSMDVYDAMKEKRQFITIRVCP
jgi:hypothetical protein